MLKACPGLCDFPRFKYSWRAFSPMKSGLKCVLSILGTDKQSLELHSASKSMHQNNFQCALSLPKMAILCIVKQRSSVKSDYNTIKQANSGHITAQTGVKMINLHDFTKIEICSNFTTHCINWLITQ